MHIKKLEKFDYSVLESQPGKILLEGKRYLLINADAHGKLRMDLIDNLGMERAKGFLLRYGWACGVHDAKDQKKKFPHISEYELIKKGAHLHKFEGNVDVRLAKFELNTDEHEFYLEAIWIDSYEAEQHIEHFGTSDEPICWTLLGYAGGYATELLGKDVYYKEIFCRGKGDDRCFAIGKTLEEWGDEITDELHYYHETKIAEELDVAYKRIQRQNMLLQQTMNLHEQLNQMVLSGKGIETVIEKVGSLINHPIIIENVHLEPVSWWIPKRSSKIQQYLISTYINDYPELKTIIKKIEKEKKPFEWCRNEKIHHTIVPILVGDELEGYLSVIHLNDEESEFFRMVADRTAGVIALDIAKEKIRLETEHRLKGEFIEELLDPSKYVDSVKNRALFMGYDFEKKHQTIIWEIDPKLRDQYTEDRYLATRKKLFKLINNTVQTYNKNALIVERQQGVLSIIFSYNQAQTCKIVEEINRLIKKDLHNIAITICVSKVSNSIEELREVYAEAQNTLKMLTNLGRVGEIFYVDNMKTFDYFYAGASKEQLIATSRNLLKPLLQFDQENNSELSWTLYKYLSNDCQIQTTAYQLNLSVSGLKYRMQKIKELGFFDLESSEERFNLLLSLKILRANGLL